MKLENVSQGAMVVAFSNSGHILAVCCPVQNDLPPAFTSVHHGKSFPISHYIISLFY
jgi:hypothetical protein